MAAIVDDRSPHCIPFILERLKQHRASAGPSGTTAPFFLGINGIQGAGKTTLVETLYSLLTSPPHNLPTAVLSIDDLYLPHDQQVALAQQYPDNPLVQSRGQPSTHDVKLGARLFLDLKHRAANVKIPSYDKSAFSGQGDRRDSDQWRVVNADASPKIEVVIFEGWCVGFRPLEPTELERKWSEARQSATSIDYAGRLGKVKLEDVQLVNTALKSYDVLTDYLDALIHVDTNDTLLVYKWREEQETALRKATGSGMTPEQVVTFVNGYYPAYELYCDRLRQGVSREPGKQLTLTVDANRRVEKVVLL